MGRSAKITRTVGFAKQKKIAKGKDWRASGAKAIRDDKKLAKREVHHPALLDDPMDVLSDAKKAHKPPKSSKKH
jgi:hypothetical protein